MLIIGRAERFQCGKQIASYLGLVPLEESSGNRRRLGHITKQGNSLLRFLRVEAVQVTVRSDQEWRKQYFHLALRRGRKIAHVNLGHDYLALGEPGRAIEHLEQAEQLFKQDVWFSGG